MAPNDADRFVLVLGGSGFIGSSICARMVASGWRAIVPTRREQHANHLLPLPSVDVVVKADIHDDATLDRLVRDMDAVINLVGILHGSAAQYERVHVELPRRVAAACARNGVHHLLHMSALGASPDAPSMYLRSKAAGEAAARSEPAVGVTVFRPSVVFGPGDNLLNLFAWLQKWLPVMAIGGADARFQPVFVEDVARVFVMALNEPRSAGWTFELGGPQIYTLRELVRMAGRYSGHARPIIGLPQGLARLQALLLEWMPGETLMSRDNLDSLRVDAVTSASMLDQFGFRPTALEAVAPDYLRPLRADAPRR